MQIPRPLALLAAILLVGCGGEESTANAPAALPERHAEAVERFQEF